MRLRLQGGGGSQPGGLVTTRRADARVSGSERAGRPPDTRRADARVSGSERAGRPPDTRRADARVSGSERAGRPPDTDDNAASEAAGRREPAGNYGTALRTCAPVVRP